MYFRTIAIVFVLFALAPFQAFAGSPATILGMEVNNSRRNFVVNMGAEQSAKQVIEEQADAHGEALKEAGARAIGAAATLGTATVSAAMSGAGALAAYAGTASAVSTLGLGGATTAIGSALAGHSVAGAAATAVCTTAVGGPLVMGALVTGAVALTGYGIYRAASWAIDLF